MGLFRKRANTADTDDETAPVTAGGIDMRDPHARLALLDDYERTGLSWIWATDAANKLIYLSPGAAEHLGLEPERMLDQPLESLFETDPDDPDGRSSRPLKFQIKARGKLHSVVVRCSLCAKKPSADIWWQISAHPKFDDEGHFLGYRGSAKDVTVEYNRKLEDSRLAEFDSLTGLYNRHRMTRRLESMLAAFKMAKRSCALMMLDLDKFKQVNDTMGHQAGDELLKMVAERLISIIGDSGHVGRLGGDEFQVILPDLDDRGKLGELADKIIQILSQPYPIDNKRAVIGTSVGIAIAPYDGIESEDLIQSSDLALYAAKHGGRGQFRFYSADLKDGEVERQELLDDLRDALVEDQLELHYQPVVRCEDSAVVGFEALMRWNHPERGMVPPDSFIPIAESTALINRLGEWALRRACADAAEWPESVRVAVNVSPKQFSQKGFLSIVTNALAESELAPDRLELELTESVFMGDSETVEEMFDQLKKLGVRIALDDFGTGYSSLSYLRAAPFDKLKVDKSFVDSCTGKDQNSAKIIAAIIGLSDALGMDVTVEGVEAFDQLELVKEKGAKFIQGWLYAKALPLAEVLERMEAGEWKIEPDGPDTHRPERRSVFRRIGVIHEDHRYGAMLRDLSKTGALVEGLVGVPQGEKIVLDLGNGQLAVGTVARAGEDRFGVEFETELVSDGAGGLCTRHRVSPYALAAAGMPLEVLPQGAAPKGIIPEGPKSPPRFMEVVVGGMA
ncbi:putative bifunctional diguanylate cyclase/phosphodiesterase [Pseudoblastomonas halimionae]|uniref:EAL domain-containing protein n=1 Tax=Alteriqipengyuania halimionae TaxID=1926630 RepID=A0A6I4U0J2_9SPHN|nr:EAL domain-containing protein [Alteriqipengyuania halimionae]MXP09296.1 EAL domain-containing protein [Alteriqipengyuania halimionae]